jgi:hypothetical protein
MVDTIVSVAVSRCVNISRYICTYFLQLRQNLGRKSNCPQYSSSQCLPMSSTSPVVMMMKVWRLWLAILVVVTFVRDYREGRGTASMCNKARGNARAP